MGEPLSREELIRRLNARPCWYVTPLAELLGVNVSTIYRWIYEGHIKPDRRGPHRTLVPSVEVMRHLERLEEVV